MSFTMDYFFNKQQKIKKRKENVTCECGVIIRDYNYNSHKLSNVHKDNLKKIKKKIIDIPLEDKLKLKIEIIDNKM
jgi:hypothetical protein